MFYVFVLNYGWGLLTAIPTIYILGIVPVALRLIFNPQPPKHPKGCRRLGLPPGRTNLYDEYHAKYTQGVPSDHTNEAGKRSWCVKALFTYPIKSCAGVELLEADVVSTGLAYDRQFCFAEYVVPNTTADGQRARWDLRTLRDGRFSRLALLRPEIWVPDPLVKDYHPGLDEVRSEGVMVVYYPRGKVPFLQKLAVSLGLIAHELSFTIPLSPPSDDAYPSVPVKIWKDYPVAYDYGKHIPQSLRDFLASTPTSAGTKPITLFRVNPSHHREIFRNAPRTQDLGFQPVTGFADAYPIHLLNLASVRDVASRCASAIPDLSIRRFRPNIIIQGPAAFDEDHWKRIRLQSRRRDDTRSVEIHTVCRTVRCRLPNVDPDTGIRHPSEPDRALKSYRCIDPGCDVYACLGMQLVPSVPG